MSKFIIASSDYLKKTINDKTHILIKTEKFESFNESILGLGKIENKSEAISALSVLFDLEGFTNFCKQIDPQLAVPEFLSEFLHWLFTQIREELTSKKYPEGYTYYATLPLTAKFMGDGVLFVWNTKNFNDTDLMNIVLSMNLICDHYVSEFIPKINRKIVSAPNRLRCGIARGTVYSVGDGNDFVGPCINMSARLQKINFFSCCFSRRGLNPETNSAIKKSTITIKANIRGVGADELICVNKEEYNKLSQEDKANFQVV